MDASSDLRGMASNVSGELFDLSVPSLNNEFGYEHITYTIRYGIFYPISKYRQELQTILKDGGPPDDKSSKRYNRLSFLLYCENFWVTKNMFPYFCSYINGGGSNPDWAFGQYRFQDLIISVAGGNIITTFGQLIANMIDVLILSINDRAGDPYPYDPWDIADDDYEPATWHDSAIGLRDYLYSTSFSDWRARDYSIINSGFERLTSTNQLLLTQLENDTDYSKEQLWFMISKHFLTYEHGDQDSAYDTTFKIATSPASDFDYKLSPNLHPDLRGDEDYSDLSEDNSVDEFIQNITDRLEERNRSDNPPSAGFMLLRAKTLIICDSRTPREYTNKQLKQFQKACARELGPWVYSLFPQTMQREYLDKVRQGSDCHKFLEDLWNKKQIISSATRYNIDAIIKFFLSGAYQPMNPNGDLYAVVPPQENSTEAIISYLNQTTFNLNKYIQLWLQGRLIYQAGYAQDQGIPDFDYDSICDLFLSLNTILYNGRRTIPRLCTDLLITFLNDPRYSTEAVLESLINTVSQVRDSPCYMPGSDVILVPSDKEFSNALKTIKTIIETLQFDDGDGVYTGLPDGVKITINAIKSESRTTDTRLEELEDEVINLQLSSDDPPNAEYIPVGRGDSEGGYKNKAKKHKTKKHKTKKHKTKKHKTKKHKTKKHRTKKHKTKIIKGKVTKTKKYKVVKLDFKKYKKTRKL